MLLSSSPKTHFQEWVDRKLSIARGLRQGELGGSYYDAALIVSALIGCLSAFAWPRSDERERNDRRRFVEAWTKLSPPNLGAHRISMPLFIADLESAGKTEIAKRLRAKHRAFSPGYASLMITGDDVDLSAENVKETAPELDTKEIRGFSYGSVFYTEIRSGLVHEYQLGRNAEAHSMAREAEGPSYDNLFEHGSVPSEDGEVRRTIHFPPHWLEPLVRSIAEKVEPLMERGGLPRPEKWWLNGG
jgi:hypothetical protein